jgi:hypothetical protein
VAPQNGFASTSTVKFTCSGLPAGASCAFSPATVTATGDIVSTLTVNTSTMSAAATTGLLFSGSSLAVALVFVRSKRRRGLQLMLLLPMSVVALTLMTGCGGGHSPGTPSVTAGKPVLSTVTVTAVSGAIMHAATFSLTVGTTTASLHDEHGSSLPASTLAVVVPPASSAIRAKI